MTDQPVDLEGVRRGDALLEEAKRLNEEKGLRPRAVPLEELAMKDKQTFTVADVAELFDVDPQTVRRWCREGELQAAKLGNYRVSRPALEAFWRKRGGGKLFEEPTTEEE